MKEWQRRESKRESREERGTRREERGEREERMRREESREKREEREDLDVPHQLVYSTMAIMARTKPWHSQSTTSGSLTWVAGFQALTLPSTVFPSALSGS